MNTVDPDSTIGLAAQQRASAEKKPEVRDPHAPEADLLPAPSPMPLLPLAVNARGLALGILATLACVYALYWAQKFFIPLVFGILISYTLNPVVNWFERIRIPRIIATVLVIFALLGGIGVAGQSLYAEFQSIVESLPQAARQLSRSVLRAKKGQPTTMQQMQAAATEIEKATNPDAAKSQKQLPVAAAQPSIRLNEWLWAGSMSAIGLIGEITMVLLLVFFLLLSGDSFKRKLVRLAGPSISTKKTTLHILEDIHTSIQSYMFMLLTTNTTLALLMWLTFRWFGLENAGAWALAAGLLHIIPYFGPLLIAVASGITAFMQFQSFSKMLLVSGSSLVIATLVGMLMTTWMTGKIAKMNAAAVFIILLFWGWLWGIWGMLLGIPIIVIIKVISEHIDGLQPITELLSE
jgi:predicted PurR-regulated permease PerM